MDLVNIFDFNLKKWACFKLEICRCGPLANYGPTFYVLLGLYMGHWIVSLWAQLCIHRTLEYLCIIELFFYFLKMFSKTFY